MVPSRVAPRSPAESLREIGHGRSRSAARIDRHRRAFFACPGRNLIQRAYIPHFVRHSGALPSYHRMRNLFFAKLFVPASLELRDETQWAFLSSAQ